MVVPNSGGYTLFGTNSASMKDSISREHNKLLTQHHIPKYRYLVDRLISSSAVLYEIFEAIRAVSPRWYKQVKGSIVGMMMRRYIVFYDKPQWFGYYGDFLFASNYSQIKLYIDKIISVLKHNYNLEKKYYKTSIPKKQLIYLSKLWANDMLPLCEKLVPKWKALQEKDRECSSSLK